MFRFACDHDVKGVVAKSDPYLPKNATWLKIRNRGYSQWIDRQELFERECAADPDFAEPQSGLRPGYAR